MLEQEYQYFRSTDFFPVYNIVQPTMPFLSLQMILKFLCGTSRVRKCSEEFLLTKPIKIVINPKVLIQHFFPCYMVFQLSYLMAVMLTL